VQKQRLSSNSEVVARHPGERREAVCVDSSDIAAFGNEERSRVLILSAHSTRVQRSSTASCDIVDEIGVRVEQPR
jgi:hypothetical protein